MINWSQIDKVLLDMDGTLLDLHFDSYFWLDFLPKHYAAFHGLEEQHTRTWLHQKLAQQQGSLNWYCLDFWDQEFGLNLVQLKCQLANKIAFRPHVKEFLGALRQQNIPSLIVTNAHYGSLNLKKEQTGIHKLVDEVVCSHDFQQPKESQIFWQEFSKQHPFDLQRTLFIDDSFTVLRAAKEFGIKHLLSISQPDSQLPKRQSEEFPMLDSFADILPKSLPL